MKKESKLKDDIIFTESERIIESNNLTEFENHIISNNVNLNIKDQFENTLLHIAAMKGSLSIIEYLIKNKMNINSKNNLGKTPLHLSVKHENIEVSVFLIKNGADYTIRDRSGRSPIESATREKRVILQKYLR